MYKNIVSPGTLLLLGLLFPVVASGIAIFRGRGRKHVRVHEIPVVDELGFGCEFLLSFWLMSYVVADRPFFPTPYTYQLPTWALGTGFGVYALAGLLNGWARATLGKNWIRGVGLHADQTLNHTGIYKRMRNPMYTSYWLMALGLIGTGELLTIGLALGVAICYSLRIPREEKILRQEFGSYYLRYKAQTGRFFPRFRRPRCVPHVY